MLIQSDFFAYLFFGAVTLRSYREYEDKEFKFTQKFFYFLNDF